MEKSCSNVARPSLRSVEGDVLPESFYSRETRTVAKELLGKLLRARVGRTWRSGIIVEDEAYLRNDSACHAYKGETKRNHSMFMEPGTAYVYRIHQVYCLNAATREGEAVLIRAMSPEENIRLPTDGPGRLCRALSVTREAHDGVSLVKSKNLQICEANRLGRFD